MADSHIMSDYHLLKKFHYCVSCGKMDAYTMIGRIQCCECAQKTNESHRKGYYINGANEIKKELRTQRKEKGLCIECGEKAENGKSRCKKHLAMERNRQEKYRRRAGVIPRSLKIQLGYCANCNEVATHGKICGSCYEKAMRGLDKATQIIREKHEYEQKNRGFNA